MEQSLKRFLGEEKYLLLQGWERKILEDPVLGRVSIVFQGQEKMPRLVPVAKGYEIDFGNGKLYLTNEEITFEKSENSPTKKLKLAVFTSSGSKMMIK